MCSLKARSSGWPFLGQVLHPASCTLFPLVGKVWVVCSAWLLFLFPTTRTSCSGLKLMLLKTSVATSKTEGSSLFQPQSITSRHATHSVDDFRSLQEEMFIPSPAFPLGGNHQHSRLSPWGCEVLSFCPLTYSSLLVGEQPIGSFGPWFLEGGGITKLYSLSSWSTCMQGEQVLQTLSSSIQAEGLCLLFGSPWN